MFIMPNRFAYMRTPSLFIKFINEILLFILYHLFKIQILQNFYFIVKMKSFIKKILIISFSILARFL